MKKELICENCSHEDVCSLKAKAKTMREKADRAEQEAANTGLRLNLACDHLAQNTGMIR